MTSQNDGDPDVWNQDPPRVLVLGYERFSSQATAEIKDKTSMVSQRDLNLTSRQSAKR